MKLCLWCRGLFKNAGFIIVSEFSLWKEEEFIETEWSGRQNIEI